MTCADCVMEDIIQENLSRPLKVQDISELENLGLEIQKTYHGTILILLSEQNRCYQISTCICGNRIRIEPNKQTVH